MKSLCYAFLCLGLSAIGFFVGSEIGIRVGEQMHPIPADGWAGDSIDGVFDWFIGSLLGAFVGLTLGVLCCLVWRMQGRKKQGKVTSESINAFDRSCPPPKV